MSDHEKRTIVPSPEQLDESAMNNLQTVAQLTARFRAAVGLNKEAQELQSKSRHILASIGELMPGQIDIPEGYKVRLSLTQPDDDMFVYAEQLSTDPNNGGQCWTHDIFFDISMDEHWPDRQFFGSSLSFDYKKETLWAYSDDRSYRVLVDGEFFSMDLIGVPANNAS